VTTAGAGRRLLSGRLVSSGPSAPALTANLAAVTPTVTALARRVGQARATGLASHAIPARSAPVAAPQHVAAIVDNIRIAA
jgi:hypothetical protein